MNTKYQSILTIDFLKLCYKNIPFQRLKENWKGEKKPYTGYLNYEYLSTFYEGLTNSFVINDKVKLLNITDDHTAKTEKYSFNVFFNDVLIGILYTDSINPDFSYFKFENSIFYDSYYSIQFINTLLENTFNLKFNHITTLEIALDTTFDVYSMYSPIIYRCDTNPYFNNIHKVTIEDQKKYAKNIKPVWKNLQGSKVNQIETSLYIGDYAKSGKSVKMYNKTEYSRSHQKQFFEKNLPRNVIHRIEIKLSKPLGYNISEKFDFFRLDDQDYINEIGIQLLKPSLKFQNINTKKIVNCINKLKIVNPVMFDLKDKIENIINNYTTIEETKPKRSINVNKMQFKRAVKECLKNDITVRRVIDLIKANDLSKESTVNPVFINGDGLKNNKSIALNIIHSMVNKEIKVIDTTIYNRLIQEIEKIEIPDITFIQQEIEKYETENI